jgi:malto-oligosyltrehalose synthase/4-alpha-glucanotransferase
VSESEGLLRLAELCGIEPQYRDIWGQTRQASEDTLRALLRAMGLAVSSDIEVEAAIADREAGPWRRLVPPALVVPENKPELQIDLSLPERLDGAPFQWRVREEGGRESGAAFCPGDLPLGETREVQGERFQRRRLTLPMSLPIGYHRLEVQAEGGDPAGVAQLIVTPEACYLPAAVQGDRRVWGPSVQLYALRSRRNWGVGDFGDVHALVDCCSAMGADVVGLSPLHAMFPHNPSHASPYSPSSRLFLNVLYLDVEAIPEYLECEAAAQMARAREFQQHVQVLRNRELVDWPGVAAAKLPILTEIYRCFRSCHLLPQTERGQAFRRFQDAGGIALYRHALFEAIQEQLHRDDPRVWGWPAWPEELRDPVSPAVVDFAARHQEQVEFYQYLQWIAEGQLETIGQRCMEHGLGLGLYFDVALGADRGGAETWSHQDLYAVDASIGAPPDDFNLSGQNWGLPPPIPEHLAESAYQPFSRMLRRNMRQAGAIRIDHVMSLMRLFWVPEGGSPAQGAYVRYPLQDLLRVLALESQRNRCLVIGEDLGTVPQALRETLAAAGVLSYRVLYFEKDAAARFRGPEEYPAQALAAVSTHDLPTLAGFWEGRDLAVRRELGLFPSDEIRQRQILARATDRAALLLALEKQGLLPEEVSADPASAREMTPALMRAVHVFLARSPAKILTVQLEDALGQTRQANLPGTTDEHPNWRRKLDLYLEDLLTDVRVRKLTDALRSTRGPVRVAAPATGAAATGLPVCIPRATYRLQFNAAFTFMQAADLVPYLHELGVSHCYASPYLRARPGSPHGYDIIDHGSLNPEIGSLEDYRQWVSALHGHGMGQILDVVPNHMGVGGSDNAWWLGVLENGPASVYAQFFDIDWEPAKLELQGKVLLPTLGNHYGSVLENGELELKFDAARGEFSVFYYEHRFPLDPATYPTLLGHRIERLVMSLGPENPLVLEFQSLVTGFQHLPPRRDTRPQRVMERDRDKEIRKQHLVRLCEASPEVRRFVEGNTKEFSGQPGDPASFDLLHRLLEAQAYRLAYWRVASDEINYRRFFDINDLAGLRQENEEVFEATHRLVRDLIAQGDVDGLRIDHPDGLQNPLQYYQRLARYAARRLVTPLATETGDNDLGGKPRAPYVVVEKILAAYEHLPEDWAVQGTTGYDFANQVNGLFVYPGSEQQLDQIYAQFIGRRLDFDELLYERKKLIMKVALASELNVLANQLERISETDRHSRDYTLIGLRDALMEVVACFPVYRTYVYGDHISTDDRRYVEWAVGRAKSRNRAADVTIFDFIRSALLPEAGSVHDEATRQELMAFAMKFQQYTAPVMAKGLEDTSFYVYNRLVSLNEVGGDPRRYGVSLAAFHRSNQEKVKRWPHSMLGTSTHDSKRAEDVRARIDVLSEVPAEWRKHLTRWTRLNRRKKRISDGRPIPFRNDEYLLYQTLVGAWPLETLSADELEQFRQRIASYMLKAVREAKVETSWVNPNQEYEEALVHFIQGLLSGPDRNPFLADFLPFQRRVSHFGMLNSLSQVLLKLTCPGVPDIYQGSEVWDFSLVDPDNRRPVDYARRGAMLEELRQLTPRTKGTMSDGVRRLVDTLEDGRAKMYLTWRGLAARRDWPELFEYGDYVPLATEGTYGEHLCAFSRSHGTQTLILIAPRWYARLGERTQMTIPLGAAWVDTRVEIQAPGEAVRFLNALTGENVTADIDDGRRMLWAKEALGNFPVAILWAIRSPGDETGH